MTEFHPDTKAVKFTVAGSVTGPDGEGTSTAPFRSKSGRVVIEPGDWNLEFCLKVFKRPLPVPFAAKWKAVLLGRDEFVPATGGEVVTVAQGLPNGKHRLELTGGPVTAVRVYRPTLTGR